MTLGSPPRVRGKVQSLVDLHIRLKDHPRVCGEKTSACVAGLRRGGSPPRVRGKALAPSVDQILRGITPACAGKRTTPRIWCSMAQDHPRVCGEKHHFTVGYRRGIGSPPRVRGKDPRGAARRQPGRITPACAGKSMPLKTGSLQQRDHPRVCGEKFWLFFHSSAKWGSPPRVRGKG